MIMVRTLTTLRLFVTAVALILTMLLAPDALSQSVSGSGEIVYDGGYGTTAKHTKFTVDAFVRKNGTAGGRVVLTTTYTDIY